jgi:hypothetical protein
MRNLRLKTKTTILVNCLLWLVVFCSCNTNAQQCENNLEPKLNDNYSNKVYIGRGGWIETIMYDSCEYLVMGQTNNGVIIHKGNCKFCADRSKNN